MRAAGQHDMRQRVLRPRLLAAQVEGRARREFGLLQQVTLFVGEGGHAVHVRNIGVGT